MAKTKHFGALAAAAGALVAVALLVLVLVLSNPQTARAAFPGANGRIAYVASDGNDLEIFTIPATGGTPFNVTLDPANDREPSYSIRHDRFAYQGFDPPATTWRSSRCPLPEGRPLTSPTTLLTTLSLPGSPFRDLLYSGPYKRARTSESGQP